MKMHVSDLGQMDGVRNVLEVSPMQFWWVEEKSIKQQRNLLLNGSEVR